MQEALAGILAFIGVLFIARPPFLFPVSEDQGTANGLGTEAGADEPSGIVPAVPATPAERSLAVLLGVLGSFGAATAYSTIRVIGKRAHSLVSVNYFAVVATVGSCLLILLHPDLEFKVPQNPTQWYVPFPSPAIAWQQPWLTMEFPAGYSWWRLELRGSYFSSS